jgi:hypothetical protein
MIQAAFFGAFDYVSKNTWAQVVVGLGFGYVILKARDKIRDRRTEARVKRRVEKKSRRVQARIEETNDEKLEQAVIARDTVQRGIRTASELSERQRSRLIRD